MRVAVFLDFENVVNEANRAFDVPHDDLRSRLDPDRLAEEVVRVGYADVPDAHLAFVEIHWGLDPTDRDGRSRVEAWTSQPRVVPVIRTNQAPRRAAHNQRLARGKECGVDLACALSFVEALTGSPPRCDAAVLFSCDVDLRPATDILPWFLRRPGGKDKVVGSTGRLRSAAAQTANWQNLQKVPRPYRTKMAADQFARKDCDNIAVAESVLQAALLA